MKHNINYLKIYSIFKKLITCTTAAALILSCLDTVNAATTYTISPDTLVNINTTDESGKTPTDVTMQLTDSRGNVIVTWKNNSSDITYASSDNKPGDSFTYDISDFHAMLPSNAVYFTNNIWNNVTGGYSKSYITSHTFKYGSNGFFQTSCILHDGNTITLSAGTLMVSIDSKWNTNAMKVSAQTPFKNYKLSANSGSQLSSVVNFDININGCSNYYYKKSTSDTIYVKKRINLKKYFQKSDSQYTLNDDFSLTCHNYNVTIPAVTTDSTYENGIVFLLHSGNMINIVLPDKDGYADVYVTTDTVLITPEIIGCYNDSSTNTTHNFTVEYDSASCSDSFKKYYFVTPSLPTTGVNIANLSAGKYTISQQASDGTLIKQESISIISNSSSIQQFNFKAKTSSQTTATTGNTTAATTKPTTSNTTAATTKPTTSNTSTTTNKPTSAASSSTTAKPSSNASGSTSLQTDSTTKGNSTISQETTTANIIDNIISGIIIPTIPNTIKPETTATTTPPLELPTSSDSNTETTVITETLPDDDPEDTSAETETVNDDGTSDSSTPEETGTTFMTSDNNTPDDNNSFNPIILLIIILLIIAAIVSLITYKKNNPKQLI